MQDRLLNAYLAGTIEDEAFMAKSNELKAKTANAYESLDKMWDVDPARGEIAVTLFNWTPKAAEIWRSSNKTVRREIHNAVCMTGL